MAKSAARKAPKASLFTKLLVVLLLTALGIQFHCLQGQVERAEAEKAMLSVQVAQRKQENAELQESIENGGSEEEMRRIARRELDMVDPNDKVFYDTSN